MSLPPLLTPVIRTFIGSSMHGKWTYLYTEEVLQAYSQQCRDAALDKAAQVCDAYQGTSLTAADCANEIRSLK